LNVKKFNQALSCC